ncbi:MAG: Phosphoserine phosphatase RsbU, N-terminal domain, partial [Desertimonas sp.]|nr:Phosphoserine phosphatase RsbU, N-terminal domain [Desertimonas sp.]
MAKPPRNSPTARGAEASRRRFESRYRSALEEHVHTPTGGGLGEAKELGRQASEAGISLRDVVSVHLEVQRDLFPDVGARFGDVD